MAQDRTDAAAFSTIPLKQRLLERWVARRQGRIDHERRVLAIAGHLFDLTAARHRLGGSARRLLHMAALVHDVGRSIDDEGHESHGARMILDDQWLPLSAFERRALAFLTLYHRGPIPAAGEEKLLADGDDVELLRVILALLRAADALDGRAVESPRLVFALTGRLLRVTCFLDEECPKARKVYRRRKKFRLLEELLGLRVDVDVHAAEALRLVA